MVIKRINFILSAFTLIILSVFSVSANSKKELSECTVTGVKNVNMQDSSAVTLPLTLEYGGAELKENTDYTVSYQNNTSPGPATVTLEGRGGYTGSLVYDFKIFPKLILSEVRLTAEGQIKLEWEADKGYDGYRIYYTTDKSREYSPYVTITDPKRTSYLFRKPVSGKSYYFKVCGYISDEEKIKSYGDYSGVLSTSVPVTANSPVLWEGVYKSDGDEYLIVTSDDSGGLEIIKHSNNYGINNEPVSETSWSTYFRKVYSEILEDGYVFSYWYENPDYYKKEFYIFNYIGYGATYTRNGDIIKYFESTYKKTDIGTDEYFDKYTAFKPSAAMPASYRNFFSKLKESYWKNEEWKKHPAYKEISVKFGI